MIFIPEVPNNSLKSELEEIVFLAKTAVNSDAYEEELLTFEFNKPVTEEELVSFEKDLNVEFEEEYKDFLRFSNGAILCFNAAEFYNLDDVNSLAKQEKEDDFPKDYIILGEVVGDGEVLCYSKNNRNYISYFEGRKKAYDSLIDFLNAVIVDIKDTLSEYMHID